MKLENQVCNLEQAKKLKDLGITAEPLFWHTVNIDPITPKDIIQKWQHSHFDVCEKYPAYTVAELGVMIPEWHFTYPRLEGYASYKNEDSHFAVADGTVNGQNYETEAECRAALIIYLLENNILSAQTCNNRLVD